MYWHILPPHWIKKFCIISSTFCDWRKLWLDGGNLVTWKGWGKGNFLGGRDPRGYHVLLLVPTGKPLELGFPNAFNKNLIIGKIWEMTRNLVLILHSYRISQFRNFLMLLTWLSRLLLSLLLLYDPTISKLYQDGMKCTKM